MEAINQVFSVPAFNEKLLFQGMSAKTKFTFENANYLVKIADQDYEFEKILKLRHDIFYKEWGSVGNGSSLDFDQYDILADHLLIKEKKSNRIIGTYRLLHSDHTENFYSGSEFNLQEFLAADGSKLEMGRVCIDKDFRNGVVLSLMWRALAQYCSMNKVEYLFGCSSVHTECPLKTRQLLQYFSNGYFSYDFNIHPLPEYDFKEEMSKVGLSGIDLNIEQMIPPILKFYLKSGAKVYGWPAIDRAFHCVDFLTILKMDEGESIFFAKYLKAVQ